MLRCLIGRAGTGKTETCLREALAAIADGGPDGPPLVLLAPEQATYQLERAMLERLPDGAAVVRLQVLSFRRLARRVLEETRGLARPRLADPGRQMLLRALLRERRAELRAFAASAERPGMAVALARQFAEFEAYAISPEELRARSGTGGRTAEAEGGSRAPTGPVGVDPLPDRLHDLALLWAAYRERLARRAFDPGSDLAAAAAALPESALAGAQVWVDGFAGFTPREEQVLAGLLAAGAQVTVTLCLDGREPLGPAETDADHPFAPTRRTLRRLLALRPAARLEYLDPPGRFAGGGDIARVEALLFGQVEEPTGKGGVAGSAGAERAAPPPTASRVFCRVAVNPRAEAEATADEIDRLCREEGYRRREIAIIVRDMGAYHDLVGPALAARGIPVFIDRKRPAGRHPALVALAAALEVIVTGWTLEAVRRYLHADLCGLRRDQADGLENFALAHGVTGPRWRARERWSFPTPEGAGAAARERSEVRMHRLRLRLVGPVADLERALQDAGAVSGQEAARALYRYLEAVRAPSVVSGWVQAALAEGRREEADWHRLCWQAAVDLLDQMALALADERVAPRDVRAAIEAGVEDLTVGLVPPRLDQVLCGAVERSRHPELRAAFVLGMGDGAFPAPPPESPLLGDGDREALRASGLELGPTAEERLLSERYLGYIALTRAAERLYLSQPAGPGPSDLWRRVQEVVGPTAPWPTVAEPTARRGLGALAADLALVQDGQVQQGAEWAAARIWLQSRPEGTQALAAATAARPVAVTVGPELAARLYPAVWTASRLETVAACAFQHFSRYGLRLRRREEAKVDPGHVGELLHEALARFVQGLLDDGWDAAALTPDEAGRRQTEALAAAQRHVLARLPEGAARGPLLVRAAGRDLARTVQALISHARAGTYRPVRAEAEFEHEGLRGKIDRIDEAVAPDGARHVRIVDYKTGSAKFTLQGFVHSLELAPALYLAAAAAERAAVPGGCFVLPVRDQVTGVAGPDEAGPDVPRLQGLAPFEQDAARLHEASLDGSVTGVRRKKDGEPFRGSTVASAQEFKILGRALDRRVARLRSRAFVGDIAADPWRQRSERACAFCEFLEVCGFDPGAGDRYRPLPAMKPDDAWAALRAEEGAHG